MIVQDWQYWPEGAWGSHGLDPARFPDLLATTDALHALGAKVMISVWPKYYPGHRELRRAAEGRPPLPAQPRHRDEGLARPRLHGLRRVRSRGTTPLLGAGRAGALLEGHRRLLARRHRARGAAEPGTGRSRHPHEPDRDRPRRARAQRLPADGQPRRVRGRAPRGPGAARGHPDPLGLGGLAALRLDRVVRRRGGALGRPARAGPGRPLVLALRHALVDDGHRRLQHRRARGPRLRGLPRALHALVPVRRFCPVFRCTARTPTRAVAVRGTGTSPGAGRPGAGATRPGGAWCASPTCATGCCPTSTRWPPVSRGSTTR